MKIEVFLYTFVTHDSDMQSLHDILKMRRYAHRLGYTKPEKLYKESKSWRNGLHAERGAVIHIYIQGFSQGLCMRTWYN